MLKPWRALTSRGRLFLLFGLLVVLTPQKTRQT